MHLRSVLLALVASACLSTPLFAQRPASFAETPKTKKADETLAETVDGATQSYAKGRDKELAAWLRSYEKALASAKAAGDLEGVEYLTKAIARSKQAGFVVKPPTPEAVTYGGHSYAVFVDQVAFHVAKRRCELMGGRLVTIQSPGEADFLVTTFGENSFWVGAGDFASEGDYRWLDGKRFDAHGYRIGFDNRGGQQHALHWRHPEQRWDDLDEGLVAGFVCEWEQ